MAESACRGRDAARSRRGNPGRPDGVERFRQPIGGGGIPLDMAQYGLTNLCYAAIGEVDLTLTRPSPHARAALTVGVDTEGSYTKALPLNARTPRMTRKHHQHLTSPNGRIVQRILSTTAPDRSTLPTVPIQGNYHFAPGQTSLTIPIRLNPRFIPPNGNTDVMVQVYDPTSKDSYDTYGVGASADRRQRRPDTAQGHRVELDAGSHHPDVQQADEPGDHRGRHQL